MLGAILYTLPHELGDHLFFDVFSGLPVIGDDPLGGDDEYPPIYSPPDRPDPSFSTLDEIRHEALLQGKPIDDDLSSIPLPKPDFFDELKKLISFNRYVSIDPNDKLAPEGFGAFDFVQADNSLAYQILFENKPIATAPAQKILVTDTLDPNLDLATFTLTGITFADQTIAIPAGLDHYETTLPIKANGVDLIAEVNASLDRATHTFTFTLQAIDPATGWLPDDPLLGLLYPDDETGRGQGSVSYVVKPVAGLPSGTVITNQAQITFDYNDPMDTPIVHNTLDAGTPTSQVDPLAATTTDSTVTVSWSGQDEAGGSGIASYDLYVSLDGGAFLPAFTGLTETSATLWVLLGHTYSFYTIAHDNVGHVEAPPATPDATTTILEQTTVNAGPDQTANEGAIVGLLGGTYTSTDDPSHLNLTIAWGDGSSESGTLLPGTNGGTIANTHRYADNGTYIIALSLTDSSGTTVHDSAGHGRERRPHGHAHERRGRQRRLGWERKLRQSTRSLSD